MAIIVTDWLDLPCRLMKSLVSKENILCSQAQNPTQSYYGSIPRRASSYRTLFAIVLMTGVDFNIKSFESLINPVWSNPIWVIKDFRNFITAAGRITPFQFIHSSDLFHNSRCRQLVTNGILSLQ